MKSTQKSMLALYAGLALITLAARAEDRPFPHVPTTVSPMAQQFLKTQTPTAGEIGSIEEWKQVRKQYNSRNRRFAAHTAGRSVEVGAQAVQQSQHREKPSN